MAGERRGRGPDREAARAALTAAAARRDLRALVDAFGSPFWELRSRAFQHLAELKGDDLLPWLGAALTGGDEDRCYWALRAFSLFDAAAVPLLLRSLASVPPSMRLFVVRALRACGAAGMDEAVPPLVALLDADDWSVRDEAAELLVEAGGRSMNAVRQLLKDGSQDQRFWAFKVMARIMGEKSVPALAKILEAPAEELSEDSRPFALAALKEIRAPAAVPPLIELLGNPSWYLRAEAAEVLTSYGDLAVKDLMAALVVDDPDVRFWVLKVLRRILGEGCVDVVAGQLASPHKGTRYAAVLTLGDLPTARAAEILVGRFSDEAWVIRKAAADAVARMGEVAVEPLLRSLGGADRESLYWSLQVLGQMGGERAVGYVARLLEHAERPIRLAAVDALKGLGGEAALAALAQAFRNDVWVVRQRASDALRGLGAPAIVHLLPLVDDEHEDVAYWARQTLNGFLLPGIEALLDAARAVPPAELPRFQEALGRADPDLLLRELRRADGKAAELAGAWRAPRAPAEPLARDLSRLLARGVGEPYPCTMDDLLREAQKGRASDLHLKVGCEPLLRVDGELRPTKLPKLSAGNTLWLCSSILSPLQRDELAEQLQLDLSYEVQSGCRYRMNVYLQTRGLEAACRYIAPHIPTFAELNLPERAMHRVASTRDGLVLVTGPTGCGKTTTLAAIIEDINSTHARHIITIEDPIEYVHQNKLSYLSYREVGLDVRSFALGLRGALREDPDVILIGELRDRETVATALTLAGTGHLVLASFHTANAAQTVEQLADFFPPEQQEHVRRQLAFILKAVISQRLFARIDRKGRIPAYEVLLTSHAVRNLIREGNTQQIFSVMQAAQEAGMITFDSTLQELVNRKIVAYDDALPFVYDPHNFKQGAVRQGP